MSIENPEKPKMKIVHIKDKYVGGKEDLSNLKDEKNNFLEKDFLEGEIDFTDNQKDKQKKLEELREAYSLLKQKLDMDKVGKEEKDIIVNKIAQIEFALRQLLLS